MTLKTNLKNILLVIFATFALSACSTAKKSGDIDGDVYTGKETVEYLAAGVPDRVFFATNKSSLTSASRATLRKQATFLRKNKKGRGSAVLYGLKKSLRNKSNGIFIEMDADFSHSFSDLKNILQNSKNFDVVIGSRYIPGGGSNGWDFKRKLLSTIFHL